MCLVHQNMCGPVGIVHPVIGSSEHVIFAYAAART